MGDGTEHAGGELAELFELSEAVCVVDRDFRVRRVNAAHERLTGLPRAATEGKLLRELFPVAGRPDSRVGNACRHAMSQRVEVSLDEYFEPLQRWFHVRAAPLGTDALAIFFADITAHKKSQTELVVSEERMRLFVEHTPAAIAVLDRDLRYVVHSRRFVTDFNLGRDTLVGLHHYEVMPEIPEHWRQLHRRALEGESFRADEEQYVRQDGTTEWIHWEVVPWLDSDLAVGGIIIFTEHLTRYKQAEQALAHQLEMTRRAEEKLRHAQKMEAVGRLAGGIAHDFNNVLTVVMAGADSIASSLDDGHPLREETDEIKKASERATSLTRQLLAISRKQAFSPRAVDLNAHVRGLETMVRRLVGEEVEVRFVLDPALAACRVDPGQLEQVLLNLVINGRDAMPSGGVLTIETGRLDEEHRAHGYVTVTDTGVGMTGEVKERIFEPFFTTKAFGKGTGLGLSMVYGIVEQHGGTITVDSEPGRGSRFRVSFPCDVRPADVVEPPTPPRVSGPNVETVLVVDDEEQVRASVAGMLRRAGFQVLVAAGGEEALRLIATHQGDLHLLLTDVKMPGMNGPALAQRVLAARPGTRVVFMSGYTGETAIGDGLLASKGGFLSKPFSSEALIGTLRAALARH